MRALAHAAFSLLIVRVVQLTASRRAGDIPQAYVDVADRPQGRLGGDQGGRLRRVTLPDHPLARDALRGGAAG